MSVLVVGISHKSAPVQVLERFALTGDRLDKLVAGVADCEYVAEATALSTCNRIEVYAEVDRFHGSVEAISRLLCEIAETSVDPGPDPAVDLLGHLYVHYDDGAVSHLFQVASGLDSMVVGESQILGQVREALRSGQEHGTVGPALNLLFQQALRIGKRAHAETDLDRAAPSLVSASLARAGEQVGDIVGRRVVVVGAGSLASLAASTSAQAGADLVVVNRTPEHAERLAATYGGRAAPLAALVAEVAEADILLACTGATGIVLDAEQIRLARAGTGAALVILDLALPHDIDPAAGELPGVSMLTLAGLADQLADAEAGEAVTGVRAIVAEELAAYLGARRSASVTPTVVALRTMATGVVDAELARLFARTSEMDEQTRAAVTNAMRRVADKLLHQPTVRVRELADQEGAVSYATALAELFALDQEAVEAVTRAEGV